MHSAGISIFYDSPPSRVASDLSAGESLDAPRSPRWSSAPVLSPSRERAVVWGGRGTTARREAKWSSGVAAVFGAYYNRQVFKDPFGHSSTLFWVYYTQDVFEESTDVSV